MSFSSRSSSWSSYGGPVSAVLAVRLCGLDVQNSVAPSVLILNTCQDGPEHVACHRERAISSFGISGFERTNSLEHMTFRAHFDNFYTKRGASPEQHAGSVSGTLRRCTDVGLSVEPFLRQFLWPPGAKSDVFPRDGTSAELTEYRLAPIRESDACFVLSGLSL